MSENSEIHLTTQQMTALFEITRQGLSRWVERGMPKKEKNQFVLNDCLRWIKANVWGVGVGKTDLAEEKLKFQRARTLREELKAKQEQGELVEKGQAIHWLTLAVTEAKTALLGLPRRMSPVLSPLSDEKEIEVALRTEIYKILNQLGHSGKSERRT